MKKIALLFVFYTFAFLALCGNHADAKRKIIKAKIIQLDQVKYQDKKLAKAMGDICSGVIQIKNRTNRNINGAKGKICIYDGKFLVKTFKNVNFQCIYSKGGKAYYIFSMPGKKKYIKKYTFKYIYKETKKYKIIKKNNVKVGKYTIQNDVYNEDDDVGCMNNVYMDFTNNNKGAIHVDGVLVQNGVIDVPKYITLKGKESKREWMLGSDNVKFTGKYSFIVTGVYRK